MLMWQQCPNSTHKCPSILMPLADILCSRVAGLPTGLMQGKRFVTMATNMLPHFKVDYELVAKVCNLWRNYGDISVSVMCW